MSAGVYRSSSDRTLQSMDAFCYHGGMSVSLHIRELPDAVHESLNLRARRRGMSLRQYTISVLSQHCETPTPEEWLDGLRHLTPARASISAAQALSQAREDDDLEVLVGRAGR